MLGARTRSVQHMNHVAAVIRIKPAFLTLSRGFILHGIPIPISRLE
jgi:hypothetical protein